MPLKPILVTLTQTRHKTQPWTVEIDMPGGGPDDQLLERYTVRKSARRGALRHLKATFNPLKPGGFPWVWNVKGREVVFNTVKRKGK